MTGRALVAELTWHEVSLAAIAGCQRNLQGLARGRPVAFGVSATAPGGTWGIHIEGACAELAVAKATGSYWEPVWSQTDDQRDDVEGWQVRSTARDNGALILHPTDPDDARFVLLVGLAPRYRIAGWIDGAAGKRQEFWRTDTGRPAFFVPQSALQPFSTAVAA